MKKYKFGDRGKWTQPESERTKARIYNVVVLESVRDGLLYIFILDKSIKNLTYRTFTIFEKDFIPEKEITSKIDIPISFEELEELRGGRSFNWTFDTGKEDIEVHIFNEDL